MNFRKKMSVKKSICRSIDFGQKSKIQPILSENSNFFLNHFGKSKSQLWPKIEISFTKS